MKRSVTKGLNTKTIYQRLGGLVCLFLLAGSIAYPNPANWLLGGLSSVTGVAIPEIRTPFVLGLDLQGGTHLEYEADVSKVAPADHADALSGVRDVIERRVNTLGVSEPLVQTTKAGDDWRVTIELAGISDINQAIRMIGETPILEFKEANEEQARGMTAEERQKLQAENVKARSNAEDLFEAATATGADFLALAKEKNSDEALKTSGGDVGFLHHHPTYGDLLDILRDTEAGKVHPEVIERIGEFVIAKVEEVKVEGEETNARHLLISYAGAERSQSELSKEDARKKIDELKAQATVANFESLVKKNSLEPGAAEQAGDLGWFGPGVMVEAFEKALAPQAVGTISDVVESPFGFHLIHKIATRPLRDIHARIITIDKLTIEELVPQPEPWKATGLTGKQLESSRVEFDQQTGTVQVALQFNSEGSTLFAELTKKHIGKQIAIFLDGQPISAPVVQAEILGGKAVISGNFTIEEAKVLARRLQAGALPIPIELIAQQSVGPTLGADSLQSSLVAGLVGFALVAIFMILMYRLPGLASVLALFLYAALSAAAFKLIPVTLSLAGIAGFILSLGIAVDANVLIFERLKEELKLGKSLSQAMEDAFVRAWLSIRDGHVTVLISCAVLFWFSSSIIKGFALTLALGTSLSLFTAVVTARTFLRAMVRSPLAHWHWFFLKPREKTKT